MNATGVAGADAAGCQVWLNAKRTTEKNANVTSLPGEEMVEALMKHEFTNITACLDLGEPYKQDGTSDPLPMIRYEIKC